MPINKIRESVEFRQMEIYFSNGKYDKALGLINTVIDANSLLFKDPQVQILLLKQKYEIYVTQKLAQDADDGDKAMREYSLMDSMRFKNVKEAQMTLLNMRQVINQNKEDFELLTPDVILQTETDLLLHLVNNSESDFSSQKLLDQATAV